MISLKLQVLLVLISLISLVLLINMIVKYKLELKYSLLWILFNIITIVFATFPSIPEVLSVWLGFEKPVNAVFLFGILISLIIIFSLTITISNTQNKLKQLSQELGINKLQYKQLYDELIEIKKKNCIESKEL